MNKIRIAFSKKQWMLSITLVLLIFIVLLWSKMNFAGKNRIINGIEIEFDRSDDDVVILNKQETYEIIQGIIGNPTGMSASEIPLTQLELELRNVPEIDKAIAYISFSGKLKLNITERSPIALMKTKDHLFYIDSNLIMFEKKPHCNASVILVSGRVSQSFKPGKKITQKNQAYLGELLKSISSKTLWSHLFEQCYVDKYKRLLLYPRIGKHSIVLNNVQNMDEKLDNLRLFYRKALPKVGWNKYKEIDISYKDQIVARRRVTYSEQKQ